MSTDQLHDVLRQLRTAALLEERAEITDGQLLEWFVVHRDEAAFAALVRRHGPMVLGVCRRVLRHAQDAEDAFQATFLVLVRRAAAIGQRELIGNWLYGVAYRTALEARAANARRRRRERQVSPLPEPAAGDDADAGRDLRPLLDQALNRLPEKYRVPVVLCDLEGVTRRDAARQLGIPVGTLSGRLTTARRLLAKRLARHGLTLAGGALTAALSSGAASAGVPAPLVAATVEAATAVAAGPVAAGVIAAQVVTLVEGVQKAMFLKKLKIAAVLWLAVGLIVGGAAVVVQANREAADAGAPKVLQLGTGQRGRRVVWSPDGKTLAVVTIHEHILFGRKGSAIKLWDVETGKVRHTLAESKGGGLAFQGVAFSADGKSIAATVSEEVILPGVWRIRDVVKIWDATTGALKQTLGTDSQLVCVAWSPDGTRVAAGDPSRKTVTVWNAGTGALEQTLPTGQAQPWSVCFAPNRRALLAVGGQKGGVGELTLWDARTGKLQHALPEANGVTAVAFSPDGKTVASCGRGELIQLWGVEKGERTVSLKGDPHGHRTVAFAPDGKRVAAGGPDGQVYVWDAQTGALTDILKGHGAEIYAVAFAPDGQTLASASQDQTVRLWPVPRAAEPR